MKKRNKTVGKTCIVKKKSGCVVMTRDDLSDMIDTIIEDDIFFGIKACYDGDSEVEELRKYKREIMHHFDTVENPVFDFDEMTELPVIPNP